MDDILTLKQQVQDKSQVLQEEGDFAGGLQKWEEYELNEKKPMVPTARWEIGISSLGRAKVTNLLWTVLAIV